MTRRLLSIGECMVELSPAGEGLYRTGFAGDTFNTAWYMQKLVGPEVEIQYFTGIGDDAISSEMAQFVRDAGIGFAPLVVPGASVGLYMIALKDGERSFSYWRSASAAKQLARSLEALPGVEPDDVVFFSGITIAILLPETRVHFLNLVAKARSEGAQICFDPNLRPRLWETDTEMCDWTMRAAATADIVLPSYEDEKSFFGDADPEATVKRYRQQGANLVVVKDGPNDVLISYGDAPMMSVTPAAVSKVVDSTAAGDSFNAGFLASYMNAPDLEAAVRRGCEVSAQVIGKRGALVEIAV